MRFVRNARDANHGAIVDALEAAGFLVADLSEAGGGVPDILVMNPRTKRLVLIEIKTRRGRMRRNQDEFRKLWPVVVARTPAAALAAMCNTGPEVV